MSVCITSGNEGHIREQYFLPNSWRDGVLSILSSYKSQKDAIATYKIDDVLFPDTQTLVDDFTMAVEHKIMVKKEAWHKRYPSFQTYSFHFDVTRIHPLKLKQRTISGIYGKIGYDPKSKGKVKLWIFSAHPDNKTKPQSFWNNWIRRKPFPKK